jgi:putative flippase GtrA
VTRPSSEFIRFIATGGIAACVNVGVRILLGLEMPYSISIVLAYLAGMTTAFLLARAFVFVPTQGAATGEYLRFTLVNMVALIQVLLVSLTLEKILFPWWGMAWHPPTIAHALGVASPVLTSYYGHKFFSFRQPALNPDPGLN